MTDYIMGFTVYTLAIIGVIFLAFIVAKKCIVMNNFSNRKDQFLLVETSLDIGPRKTLHVVKAGDERFLISADSERTSFLTKLAQNEVKQKVKQPEVVKNERFDIPALAETIPAQMNINNKQKTAHTSSVMRGLLNKLNA